MVINGEGCRPLERFPDYVISTGGRIYRITAKNNKERKLLKDKPETQYFHEVKPSLQYSGWQRSIPEKRCGLMLPEGKLTTIGVAALVAQAFGFYPKERDYYKLVYKDGNPDNCNIDNIEFVKKVPSNQILTEEDIPKIRRLIELGVPLRHIGKVFNVCEMQINRIKTGENWNNGKRIIKPKKPPFKIEDGKIRRLVTYFKWSKVDKGLRKPFYINRNEDPEDNEIIGILKGYRFTHHHRNISRARDMVDRLNRYFFGDKIANRQNKNIEKKLDQKNIKDLNQLTKRQRV